MKMNAIERKRYLYLQSYYIRSNELQNQSNELLKDLEKKLESLKELERVRNNEARNNES